MRRRCVVLQVECRRHAGTRICIFIRTFIGSNGSVAPTQLVPYSQAKGDPLKRIRVLLAGMPTLMFDILQQVVEAEADMVFVGTIDDGDLSIAIQRTRADVVVVGQDTQGEHALLSLLPRRPQLKVLTIAADGKSGWAYDMRPRRIRLGKISAHSLATAICGRALPPSRTSPTAKKAMEVH